MTHEPMTKDEFMNLLESVLEEKRQSKKDNPLELVEQYDELYNKCIVGYEVSHAKDSYSENKIFTKTEDGFEGSEHLKYALTSLINCYGKDTIVKVLREL
tara:strand:- start:467 stop:766 length:300 start_codon:yes stop_codon:yes gene_type:complete